MPYLEPTQRSFIKQVVAEELRHVSPRMGIVEEVHPYTNEDEASNYKVDVRVEDPAESGDNDGTTHPYVPVGVTATGASRGLEPGDFVLVQYRRGNPNLPIVTHTLYDDSEPAPLTEPGDFRRRIGEDAIIEIVTDENDNRKLNIGRQPDDRQGIDMGLTMNLDGGGFCLFDGSQNGLFFDGQGNSILKWRSMAMPTMAAGDVTFDSGGSTSGVGTGIGTADQPGALSQAATLSGMAQAETMAADLSSTTTTQTLPESPTAQGGAQGLSERANADPTPSPRLPNTWVQSSYTATQIPQPDAETTVNLANEGLRDGDRIDSYLDAYLQSGVRVEIPAGEYRWHGHGLDGNYRHAGLIGLGGQVQLRLPEHATTQATLSVPGGGAGAFRMSNISIRGTAGEMDGARLRLSVLDEGTSALFDSVYLPDGGIDYGGAIGVGVSPTHAGTLFLRNCSVQGFPAGGVHASSPHLDGDGEVYVYGGLYRRNNTANIRLGSSGSRARSVTIASTGSIPDSQAGNAPRGIVISEGGNGLEIEDCDIVQRGRGPAIHVPPMAAGGQSDGTVTASRIQNDVETPAIEIGGGHTWGGEDIHLTGSGSTETRGGTFGTVTGSGADGAAVTPRRIG